MAGKRGRPRKYPVDANGHAASIDTADVTKEMFPEGVPTNSDGSIASVTDICEDDAVQIGALSPESAQYNKEMAQRVAMKQRGARNIRWGETNALHLFDHITKVFSPSTLLVYVTRTNPQPPLDFAPFSMLAVRNAEEFYDYILKNFHKFRGETQYTVTWKSDGLHRGQGYLRIPDNTADDPALQKGQTIRPGVVGQAPPYPPPPPVSNGMPWNMGPAPTMADAGADAWWRRPSMDRPWEKEKPPAPPPPQPVAVASPPPASVDPALLSHLANSYQELQRMQQAMMQNQLQIQHALGTLEEMKRQSASRPPSSSMPVYASSTGLSGPPQYAPAPVVQAPPPAVVDPMAELQKATTMITGISEMMTNIRGAMTKLPAVPIAKAAPPVEVVEPAAPTPPFQVMPLGSGENPPMYAYDPEDGSPNWTGIMLANLPKALEMFKDIKDSIGQMQSQQAQWMQAQGVAQERPKPPPLPPRPRPAPVQPPVPPPAPPMVPTYPPTVEDALAASSNGVEHGGDSFLPNSDAIRDALGPTTASA